MAGDGSETKRLEQWGPVCRGFLVLLPDGQRGSVRGIRVGDHGVELLVETGLFVRRGLIVGTDDIEAILPAANQIVVRASRGSATAGRSRSGRSARIRGRFSPTSGSHFASWNGVGGSSRDGTVRRRAA
jgi:hypothetical protein